MRLFFVFLSVVVIASVAYAETKTVEKMDIGSKETVSGKTLTILDATSSGNLKVDVDGKKGFVKYGDPLVNINEMKVRVVNFTYVDEDFVQATVEMAVDAECGDGLCNRTASESPDSCCADCGCEVGQCLSNVCKLVECTEDTGCDDSNPCTMDSCESNKCANSVVSECKSGDKCCPEGCLYENDTDCEFVGFCDDDSDCQDDNSCTIDRCEGTPLNCTHAASPGCSFEGLCYNVTDRAGDFYCTGAGMKGQKNDLESCSQDYECKTSKCEQGLCGGKPKKNTVLVLVVASAVLVVLTLVSYVLWKKSKV